MQTKQNMSLEDIYPDARDNYWVFPQSLIFFELILNLLYHCFPATSAGSGLEAAGLGQGWYEIPAHQLSAV